MLTIHFANRYETLAPSGTVGRRLAGEAPEEVRSDGLKPRTASQSPCRAPTCGCLPSGGYRRATATIGGAGRDAGKLSFTYDVGRQRKFKMPLRTTAKRRLQPSARRKFFGV
jgi:hypothetical protein